MSEHPTFGDRPPLAAVSDDPEEERQAILASGVIVAKERIDELEAENRAMREELSFIAHRLACAAEVIPAAEHYLAGLNDAFRVVGKKALSCFRIVPALADADKDIRDISQQLLRMAEGDDE